MTDIKQEQNTAITRVNRSLTYRGAILDVYSDTMEFPNGNRANWDYVAHRNGAAAVLPVLDNGHVLMVRQQRPAIEQYTLEIPAGAKDNPKEDAILCAGRELEEETGYAAKVLKPLCRVATTPAFCNEMIEIFLATDLVRTQQHLDEDEYLNVEEWAVEDLVGLIQKGELCDSKTCVAILTYYSLLQTSK